MSKRRQRAIAACAELDELLGRRLVAMRGEVLGAWQHQLDRNGGSAGVAATHNASTEKTKARSLFPIGPSYLLDAPVMTPTTPAISPTADAKMTEPAERQSNGAMNAKGR